jgi:hypothetical protein
MRNSEESLCLLRVYWSEWQDLSFRSFAIEIACTFSVDHAACVLNLCTLNKRVNTFDGVSCAEDGAP